MILKEYEMLILYFKEEVSELNEWEFFIDLYDEGKVKLMDLKTTENLGFASGLLLKQFSNSYYQKTKKSFVKHYIMRFGNKVSPDMVWKNGLLRCEELAEQWDIVLAANFRPVLAKVLLSFLEMQRHNKLIAEKDIFMTAFWSGFLINQLSIKKEFLLSEQRTLKIRF